MSEECLTIKKFSFEKLNIDDIEKTTGCFVIRDDGTYCCQTICKNGYRCQRAGVEELIMPEDIDIEYLSCVRKDGVSISDEALKGKIMVCKQHAYLINKASGNDKFDFIKFSTNGIKTHACTIAIAGSILISNQVLSYLGLSKIPYGAVGPITNKIKAEYNKRMINNARDSSTNYK